MADIAHDALVSLLDKQSQFNDALTAKLLELVEVIRNQEARIKALETAQKPSVN